MNLILLLGSGASLGAGMPSMSDITEQVLSGRNVLRRGGDFRLVDALPQFHEPLTQPVETIVRFTNDLKHLCDDYFASQDKNRTTNYEDISYVARQIEDGLMSEYENPALLPLNEELGAAAGRTADELLEIAAGAADYIDDTVRQMLEVPIGPLDHLTAVADAFSDPQVAHLDLFTLNHDLVAETMLRETRVAFSDGFERPYGTLLTWSDTYANPTRRLFKLHGSIDWYRYQLPGWPGQVSARGTGERDAFHPRGPGGEDLGFPAGGRPEILTGTFNKILSYPSGTYADQHFRFHEALARSDRLLVIGYGFRDKAINARLISWALRQQEKRLVVVHPDPDRLGEGARGAIRAKWAQWRHSGLLDFVADYFSSTMTWHEIRRKLV